MSTAPPPSPPTPPPGRKNTWIVPVVIAGAVVLLLCCAGAVVLVSLSGNPDERGRDDAADSVESSRSPLTAPDRASNTTPAEPKEETAPEPAGFGAGTWEVGAEIPAGVYVTTAPDGGVFDMCYWARLSGFSGGFDDILANENLSAGTRGRLEISASDAGVEFSGNCTWVETSQAAPVQIDDEVGAGTWAVGDEIAPGTYTTTAPDGDVFDSCYFARLSGFSGDLSDIIANSIVAAGSRGRVEISSSDAGVQFTGDCVWTRN